MSDYICAEIILQILKCLPAKSLLRFRCVCKEWKQVIYSPAFVQQHLFLQNPRFLIRGNGSPEYFVVDPHALPYANKLNVPVEYPEYSLLATHHGIVCLLSLLRTRFLLWNPSLRKFSSPFQIPYSDCFGLESGKVFGATSFGFWIDPSTKEFKFLSLRSTICEHSGVVVVGILYSSILRDWRFISVPGSNGCRLDDVLNPCMIQGVAHWTCSKRVSQHRVNVTLSFNFLLESFDLIQWPVRDNMQGLLRNNMQRLLSNNMQFNWQGNLSVLWRNSDSSIPARYHMFTREQGLWVNMFCFDLAPDIDDIDDVFSVLREEERVKALVKVQGKLGFYDNRAGVIPLMGNCSNALVFDHAHVATDFVESLLFP